jgi:protein-tyrosine phosphatase
MNDVSELLSIFASQNLDCHKIIRNLYQGSFPSNPTLIKNEGFDVLVLCTTSYQPSDSEFSGIEIIRCPFDDSRLTNESLQIAKQGAKQVANALKQDKKVLTTCHAGLNRSGFVNALALHQLLRKSGSEIVKLIQMCRPGALFNESFVNYLNKLK